MPDKKLSNPVENIKKLLNAMEQMLEALKIQQEMVQMIAQQQIKTVDYLIKMGKEMGYEETKTEPIKSSN
jgi:gamma-glutamyl phosphate reductase